ncbi:MAG: hypothetical protein U0457_18930 [Candidatus Sericytochromatia bacterium]
MFEKIVIKLASKILQKYKNKHFQKEEVKVPVKDQNPKGKK